MQVLENYIQSLEIDRLKTYRDISLCFFKRQNPTNLVALNYDEGIITQGLHIKEIDDFNALKFTNVSLFNIFVPQGVIMDLKHLKQVRSTVHGFLIKPRETFVVPVICVEEGRWGIDTNMNIGRLSPQHLYPKLRAANLKHRETINQHKVWQDIKRLREQKQVESPTGCLGDVYNCHRTEIDDYINHLPLPEHSIGFLAMFQGKHLLGLESFGNERLLKRNYEGLLSGIVLETTDNDFYEELKKKETLTVEEFLRAIASTNKQPCKAIGDSQDFRFENEHLVGSALVSGDAVYHLEAFVA
jgi:hypothetical protein